MRSKTPSLAKGLEQTMRAALAPEPPLPTAAAAPAAPEAAPAPRSPGFYAATRVGKKKVTAALAPPMHKQLKALAVERETTTEALLVEAVGDLFRKYGKGAKGAA